MITYEWVGEMEWWQRHISDPHMTLCGKDATQETFTEERSAIVDDYEIVDCIKCKPALVIKRQEIYDERTKVGT